MRRVDVLIDGYGEMLTVDQVAQVLGWSREDGAQLLRDGQLKFEVADDGLLVAASELKEFLSAHRRGRLPEPFYPRRRPGLQPLWEVMAPAAAFQSAAS